MYTWPCLRFGHARDARGDPLLVEAPLGPVVARVLGCPPGTSVLKAHAILHPLSDGTQDMPWRGATTSVARWARVVREVHAGSGFMELQERHCVQKPPRGLQRPPARQGRACEAGRPGAEASHREEGRASIYTLARDLLPGRGDLRPHGHGRGAAVVFVQRRLFVACATL